MRYQKSDGAATCVVRNSDAKFTRQDDLSLKLGRIAFLVEFDDDAVPVTFKSYKSLDITRSLLAGEVIA